MTLNALTIHCIPARFKMIVLNNGGGGIFNYIKGTRRCNSVDHYMTVKGEYKLSSLAADYGFNAWHATDMKSLSSALTEMFKDNSAPGMVVIHTDAVTSAGIMHEFLTRNRF